MTKSTQLVGENIKYFLQPSEGEAITSLLTGNTYTIGQRIGEGGFGIVYSCEDVWENTLAVKVLKPIGTYEKVKENAEGEFLRLMQLRHPCITFVYDAFEYRDTFYIITEKCHSPVSSIFDLENLTGMSWLMPMARQILQAIHYLHLNHYVHQDIHEGNVFATFIKDEMIPSKDQVIQ
ncbi:MAG: protein kinase family protein, partial [Methylococcaceae bacterium]|nr:protein kinase family protein [Methylococcaceae bacterium]